MLKKIMPMALAASTAFAASVTVDPSVTKQEVIGFGAGSVYYQDWVTHLSDANQKVFYDTAFTGLNLSMLRLGNWLQDESKDISSDVAIVKAAKERQGDKLKIEMSSWSAPAKLKPNNDVNGKSAANDSSKATLNTSTTDKYGSYAYGEFASWWKRSYQAYAAAGIAPDYISFQNEPDMFAEYEETLFAPTETSKRAGYKQALAAIRDSINSISGTKPKIIGPEPLGIGYNNFQNYMAEIDDANLDGYAYHLYHSGVSGESSLKNYRKPENFAKAMGDIAGKWGSDSKPLIMTEFCSMEENGKEEYMTELAHIMQVGFTTGKLSAYIAWELFWGDGNGQLIGICTKNWGNCTEDQIRINPEYHALRHYSKFVNPGWKVTSATSDDNNIKTVAFKNATGDSVSVILINRGSSEINLSAPAVSGMNVGYAVQSKENGFKSKAITIADCYVLPALSITTLVYTKGAPAASVNTCSDETTDSNFTPESSSSSVGTVGGNGSVTLVDYASSKTADSWTTDVAKAPTYGSTEIDGVSSYVAVPMAGCNQSEESCGYQHAYFELSTEMASSFATCDSMEITLHSMADTTTYINVGGVGSEWVDYKYGVQAGSESWVTTSISLEKEAGNASTKLKFNSDGPGFYVSKITGTHCAAGSTTEQDKDGIFAKPFQISGSNTQATLLDMNGNIVWKGLKNNALNDNGTLRLDVRQGMYILKTKNGTFKAIKK